MSFRERAASGHAGHLFRLNHKTRHVSYIAVFKFIIMNILSKIILSTAVISAGSFSSFAQPGPEGTKKSPEEFISEHAGHIADELALDDSTREKFIGTFCRFHEEMHRLLNVPDKNNRPGDVRAQEKSSLSDKEIDRKIRDRFERRQKILDLQVRYYDEYRKFLNPRQVQKVPCTKDRAMTSGTIPDMARYSDTPDRPYRLSVMTQRKYGDFRFHAYARRKQGRA